ncbi:MAG: hypothetical protein WD225_09340 [Ilumatobacteraceae bacterium]
MNLRRPLAAAVATAVMATTLSATLSAVTPSGSVSAATATISRVDAGGYEGHVGVDVPDDSYYYQSYHYWESDGSIGPIPVEGSNPWVRFEFYPDTEVNRHDYDPWSLDVGGVHVERTPEDGPGWLDLGEIVLPQLGQSIDGHTAQRIDGDIIASTPLPDDRIEIDAFQVTTVFPDPPRPLPTNANGVELGSFSSVGNRDDRWTIGVAWPGRYVMFVRDTATGNNIQVTQDLGFGQTPTIDLDATCFGFDTCYYTDGGPSATSGTFHPTPPSRILDTRFGTGIANGPVRTGGGRHESPDPRTRRDEIANHELKVTGVGGVPESGVSAVLLNVTAVAPPGPGYLSVMPKPAHCCDPMSIFDDQGSLPSGEPATSNLNVAGGDIVPNMVLARVGAGGKIRFHNSFGPTHVVADLAGWFGTGGAHTDGAGFSGIVPERAFDSRAGLASPERPFDVSETRSVQVTGVGGVPDDAESVVVNLTVSGATDAGWAAAYPAGTPLPNASNLNFAAGTVRANLAVVKVGDGGRIALHVAESSADLIVDVMGSFGPGGGEVTAIDPIRLADSRGGVRAPSGPLSAEQTVTVPVAGQAGIPADATAVVLNVSAVGADGFGYFTVWPHGSDAPDSSNVNYVAGADVPNMVMVRLGDDGAIDVRNSVSRAHLLVDVAGYVR